ncbi:MAG: hypothetical protein RLZZ618_4154 [Pseudomonadota bacterium]
MSVRAVIPIVLETSPEWHITSLVVHTLPTRVDDVALQIATLAGTQVHAVTPLGKVIVTLEAPDSRSILDAINAIQALSGVINAALVYQCADTLESMNEELPDVHCP